MPRLIIGCNNKVKFFNPESGSSEGEISLPGRTVFRLQRVDDNAFACLKNDRSIALCSLSDAQILSDFKCHTSTSRGLHFERKSNILFTGTDRNEVEMYELPEGVCRVSLRGHSEAVSSIDSIPSLYGLTFTGSADTTIRCWNWDMKKHLRAVLGHKLGVTCLCHWNARRMLFSGSYDTRVLFWDGSNFRGEIGGMRMGSPVCSICSKGDSDSPEILVGCLSGRVTGIDLRNPESPLWSVPNALPEGNMWSLRSVADIGTDTFVGTCTGLTSSHLRCWKGPFETPTVSWEYSCGLSASSVGSELMLTDILSFSDNTSFRDSSMRDFGKYVEEERSETEPEKDDDDDTLSNGDGDGDEYSQRERGVFEEDSESEGEAEEDLDFGDRDGDDDDVDRLGYGEGGEGGEGSGRGRKGGRRRGRKKGRRGGRRGGRGKRGRGGRGGGRRGRERGRGGRGTDGDEDGGSGSGSGGGSGGGRARRRRRRGRRGRRAGAAGGDDDLTDDLQQGSGSGTGTTGAGRGKRGRGGRRRGRRRRRHQDSLLRSASTSFGPSSSSSFRFSNDRRSTLSDGDSPLSSDSDSDSDSDSGKHKGGGRGKHTRKGRRGSRGSRGGAWSPKESWKLPYGPNRGIDRPSSILDADLEEVRHPPKRSRTFDPETLARLRKRQGEWEESQRDRDGPTVSGSSGRYYTPQQQRVVGDRNRRRGRRRNSVAGSDSRSHAVVSRMSRAPRFRERRDHDYGIGPGPGHYHTNRGRGTGPGTAISRARRFRPRTAEPSPGPGFARNSRPSSMSPRGSPRFVKGGSRFRKIPYGSELGPGSYDWRLDPGTFVVIGRAERFRNRGNEGPGYHDAMSSFKSVAVGAGPSVKFPSSKRFD